MINEKQEYGEFVTELMPSEMAYLDYLDIKRQRRKHWVGLIISVAAKQKKLRYKRSIKNPNHKGCGVF